MKWHFRLSPKGIVLLLLLLAILDNGILVRSVISVVMTKRVHPVHVLFPFVSSNHLFMLQSICMCSSFNEPRRNIYDLYRHKLVHDFRGFNDDDEGMVPNEDSVIILIVITTITV